YDHGVTVMSVCCASVELMPHSHPLEWNDAEEARTRALYDAFLTGEDGFETNIFRMVRECGEGSFWGIGNWEEMNLEMKQMKQRLRMLQPEIYRLWQGKASTRWFNLSSGRRLALLLWALIDVEDMYEVNLRGRRQLCPELVL